MSKEPSERKPRSGGPRSPEGKQSSAQNATQHGCTAKTLLIKGESEAEWLELRRRWMDDYKPDTETFAADVERAAQAEWLFERNVQRYNELEQMLSEKSGNVLDWLEEDHQLMERFLRYKAAAERNFYRARQAAEQRRKSRFQEALSKDRRDEQQRKAAPKEEVTALEPSVEEAAKPLEWPPLVQHFRIRMVDGQVVSSRLPKEEELRRVALRFDPPRNIRRWLFFEDGVSAEYAWIPYAEHKGEQTFRYCYDASFEEWLEMEKREAELGNGHAVAKTPERGSQ